MKIQTTDTIISTQIKTSQIDRRSFSLPSFFLSHFFICESREYEYVCDNGLLQVVLY